MKQVVALAALAGLLFSACAPQPESKGGAFDNSLTEPTNLTPSLNNGHYDPAMRWLGPPDFRAPGPGTSPSDLAPQEDPDSNPELMLPGNKNQVYHI